MLLTKQQQFILDALDKAGALREDQIVVLLCAAFCKEKPEAAPRIVSSALRQLVYCNVRLVKQNGVWLLPGMEPDAKRLDSVDIMLQLTEGQPEDFWREKAPVLLRFCMQDRNSQIFSVIDEGAELRDTAFPAQERIILLFDGQGRPRTLPVSNKQFIAVRKEDGMFRFFSKGGK